MTIEIPDKFLEYVTKMPPQKVDKDLRMKNFNPLSWIEKNKPGGCVVMVMVYRAILKRGIEMGMIRYDQSSQTWRGVDYNGD